MKILNRTKQWILSWINTNNNKTKIWFEEWIGNRIK